MVFLMRIIEGLPGKIIIDASGNEVGKVDDVEADLSTRVLEALVVKGKGVLSKQFQSERLDSLLKRAGITKTEDLLVPFDEVQAIGKFIVLKKTINIETPTSQI
jgi:sporulation protein YlmC with PRC-barrel domain